MRRVKAGIYRSLVLMVMASCLCVQAAERIVAIVGDTVITHHDITALTSVLVVQGKLSPEQAQQSNSEKQLLDFAINRLLMKQSAEHYGMERPMSDAELTQEFLVRYQRTPEAFEQSLRDNALTKAQFLNIFRDDMLIEMVQQQVVFAHATVTEKEISEYMQSYQNDNTRYHVMDFYLPKSGQKVTAQAFSDTMQAALSAWKSGEAMPAEVVQQDLGMKRVEALPEIFQHVVSGLATQKLSYMVIADNGYHALYILSLIHI